MDYYKGLKKLGFTYRGEAEDFDFELYNGTLYWRSSQPQPSDADIQTAVDQALADEQARIDAKVSLVQKIATVASLTTIEQSVLEELL
ncbi:MAG: hypothetical protein VW443_09675 [Pseudomonadales bacterium]